MIADVAQRWRGKRASYRPAGEVIQTRAFTVAPIARDREAKDFVLTHHYDGSYPAARFRLGLYRSSELVGVAVFSVPTNPLALRPFGDDVDAVELGRFVLLDDVPGNGETWFLARAFEHLRREGVSGVISFSDPVPRTKANGDTVFTGHIGTIYQAHNATHLGRARAGTLKLMPDGRVIHARALAKVRGRSKGWRYVVDRLVAAGAAEPRTDDLRGWLDIELPRLTRPLRHEGNFKYAWSLDGCYRRELAEKAQKYPKFQRTQLGLPI